MDSIVEESSPSHCGGVMVPLMSKLPTAGMSGVAADVVELTNHTAFQNLARLGDGGEEADVKPGSEERAALLSRSQYR